MVSEQTHDWFSNQQYNHQSPPTDEASNLQAKGSTVYIFLFSWDQQILWHVRHVISGYWKVGLIVLSLSAQLRLPHLAKETSPKAFEAMLCSCAQSLSYVQLCNPMDCSLPGTSVHGIPQARILEQGCHFLLQGIFPTQGSNPCLVSPALAGGFFTTVPPGKNLMPWGSLLRTVKWSQ